MPGVVNYLWIINESCHSVRTFPFPIHYILTHSVSENGDSYKTYNTLRSTFHNLRNSFNVSTNSICGPKELECDNSVLPSNKQHSPKGHVTHTNRSLTSKKGDL